MATQTSPFADLLGSHQIIGHKPSARTTQVEVDPVVTDYVADLMRAGGYDVLPPIPSEQVENLKAQVRAIVKDTGQGVTIRSTSAGNGSVILSLSIGARRGRKSSSDVNGSGPDGEPVAGE